MEMQIFSQNGLWSSLKMGTSRQVAFKFPPRNQGTQKQTSCHKSGELCLQNTFVGFCVTSHQQYYYNLTGTRTIDIWHEMLTLYFAFTI